MLVDVALHARDVWPELESTLLHAGAPIVSHRHVRGISFTGSTAIGQQIAAECGAKGKPVSLEMGGKNAQLVMDDADLDLAIEGVLWGAFGTTGQRCTATSRLILHEPIHDTFVGRLANRANALKLGDGRKKGTEVGPLVNEDARDKVGNLVDTPACQVLSLFFSRHIELEALRLWRATGYTERSC